MRKSLTNEILKDQNPYALKGIEKVPILGHLPYMNRLHIEGHSITPEEGTKESGKLEDAESYHATASSLLILWQVLYQIFG